MLNWVAAWICTKIVRPKQQRPWANYKDKGWRKTPWAGQMAILRSLSANNGQRAGQIRDLVWQEKFRVQDSMVRTYICKPPIERLNTTFLRKVTLYANYVPNRPRHGVLRDPNHSLRIEYTLRWFSKLGPSKRAVRPHTSPYLSPIPRGKQESS